MHVDTNILVRLITQDNHAQYVEAIHLINSCKKDQLTVHAAVVAELCFVLGYGKYKMKRADIARAITHVFELPQVKNDDVLAKATSLYVENSKLDFTDALLVVASIGGVMTFDKDMVRVAKTYVPQVS